MSISEDEAEKVYPTEYWNDGSGCKKVFAANTDDLQEAYIRGREAPPSDVEVEAVAKRLCYLSQPPLWFPTEPPAEQEKNLWRNMGMCDAQDEWLDKARDLLETARKAVNE
ncbi:hypothetical protein [Bifidobacterium catenulatum]|uniref:Uncharacterized protein n=1 Tax=Bifidobacterium catenulatum subsp. kashiwanohense TaxID=630129 RepID=A0AA43P9D0_9BIFI|nr:hypothetical protein [Bifidobacterium catenulatum]MDH7891158.1 hypothetical protein [Bifidobacterium catenulatum subsp. kashiwanohense]